MFAIEIYRFFDGLSPSIMKNIFQNDIYSLRWRNELYFRNRKAVKCGTETISYLVPKTWSIVSEIKE